jgi:hypothetical protein
MVHKWTSGLRLLLFGSALLVAVSALLLCRAAFLAQHPRPDHASLRGCERDGDPLDSTLDDSSPDAVIAVVRIPLADAAVASRMANVELEPTCAPESDGHVERGPPEDLSPDPSDDDDDDDDGDAGQAPAVQVAVCHSSAPACRTWFAPSLDEDASSQRVVDGHSLRAPPHVTT